MNIVDRAVAIVKALGRMTVRAWIPAVLCAIISVISVPLPASADGVLAVGITKDVARDGFVIGYSVNKETLAEARERAMNSCRNVRAENTEAAKKACAVVAEFKDKCVAIADDPKAGTTGFGWGVAPSRTEAISQAMDMCQKASSPDRTKFCRMAHASYDGSAR